MLIFKALVLQALCNLSDDQAEYQLRDRLSFMRPSTSLRRAFVGLGLEDAVPDAKTLWLYREALATAGAVEGLFNQFDAYLKERGGDRTEQPDATSILHTTRPMGSASGEHVV